MARRYSEEPLSAVLRASNASSWQDLLSFLSQHGEGVAGLSHDQLAEMQDDLQKMADRAEEFSHDAGAMYAMIDAIQPVQTVIGPGSPTPEAEAR
jgi:hypothetical protein